MGTNKGIPMQAFGVIAVIVIIFASIAGLTSFKSVGAGEACVHKQFGEVNRTIGSGAHMVNPIGRGISCYTVRSLVYETVDEQGDSKADYVDYAVDGVTRDGQQLTVTYTLRYRLPKDNLEFIHTTIGPDVDAVNERVVKYHSRTVVRQVVNNHTASELYLGGLDTISGEVFDILEPRFEESGVYLESFEIKRPNFSDEYTNAIENKQLKKEEAEAATNEQEVARQQAETKKINAQANADVELIEAQGRANATREEGAAYQEYPEILELRMIEMLEGAELIVLPSESTPLIDLRTNEPTPAPTEEPSN